MNVRLGHHTRKLLPALVAGALLSLVGPAGSAGAASTPAHRVPPTHGAAPSTVNIGEYAPAVPGSLNVTIAQALGYYNTIEKDFHTTIDFEGFTTPPPLISGLEANQLQFLEVTPANIMTAAAAGDTDFVDLDNYTEGSGSLIVGSGKEKVDGTGIAAIKKHFACGSNWAVTGLGGTSQITIEAIFSALHLGKTCANLLSVGTTGVVPAVESGRADVGLAPPTLAVSLIASGQAYNVLFTSGTALYKLLGFEPSVGLVSTPSFTKKYPALTEAIVLADLKGSEWLRTHVHDPAAAYKLLPAAYRAANPLTSWDQTWTLTVDSYTPTTGLFTEHDAAIALEDGKKFGGLSASEALPNVAEPKFIDDAYEDLGLTPPTSEIDTSYLYNG